MAAVILFERILVEREGETIEEFWQTRAEFVEGIGLLSSIGTRVNEDGSEADDTRVYTTLDFERSSLAALRQSPHPSP